MDHPTAFRIHLAITLTGILGLGSAGTAPALVGEPAGAFDEQGRVIGFDERVTCERSIAEVYWRHRIWPEENLEPKPQLPPGPSEADLARVGFFLRVFLTMCSAGFRRAGPKSGVSRLPVAKLAALPSAVFVHNSLLVRILRIACEARGLPYNRS